MMKTMRRAANRHIIPMEILLGWVSMCWGVSGGFGTGHLHELLDSAASSTAWLLTLAGIGMAQVCVTCVEWFNGGSWALDRRWRSARLRAIINFFAFCSWLWVMKLMWDYPHVAREVFVLVLLGPAMMAFEAWAFWENLKVRLAADAKIDTSQTLILR